MESVLKHEIVSFHSSWSVCRRQSILLVVKNQSSINGLTFVNSLFTSNMIIVIILNVVVTIIIPLHYIIFRSIYCISMCTFICLSQIHFRSHISATLINIILFTSRRVASYSGWDSQDFHFSFRSRGLHGPLESPISSPFPIP